VVGWTQGKRTNGEGGPGRIGGGTKNIEEGGDNVERVGDCANHRVGVQKKKWGVTNGLNARRIAKFGKNDDGWGVN